MGSSGQTRRGVWGHGAFPIRRAAAARGSCGLLLGKVGGGGRRQTREVKIRNFLSSRAISAGQGLREKLRCCQTNGIAGWENQPLIDNKANHVNGMAGWKDIQIQMQISIANAKTNGIAWWGIWENQPLVCTSDNIYQNTFKNHLNGFQEILMMCTTSDKARCEEGYRSCTEDSSARLHQEHCYSGIVYGHQSIVQCTPNAPRALYLCIFSAQSFVVTVHVLVNSCSGPVQCS